MTIEIFDEMDFEYPFPFQDNQKYRDKISEDVAKIIDVGRKRNRIFVFVLPNNAKK